MSVFRLGPRGPSGSVCPSTWIYQTRRFSHQGLERVGSWNVKVTLVPTKNGCFSIKYCKRFLQLFVLQNVNCRRFVFHIFRVPYCVWRYIICVAFKVHPKIFLKQPPSIDNLFCWGPCLHAHRGVVVAPILGTPKPHPELWKNKVGPKKNRTFIICNPTYIGVIITWFI